MEEKKIDSRKNASEMQLFMQHLLADVQALETMLKGDWFEKDIIRIGAEQEMVLIDKKTLKPAPIAMEVLDRLKQYPWVDTELARFNLEINLSPLEFTKNCFQQMEQENRQYLSIIQKELEHFHADLVLTGILPTLRKFDLEMHNLTPKPRYKDLLDAMHSQLIGNSFELRLMGIDELLVKHDSPLLEACNTSFQVHLQVTPSNFVKLYNIAQVLAAPVMAISANSPIVFGQRLWHENRIAIFQQAVDIRTTHQHMRQRSPRVTFGSGWLEKSVLEIHKEDIARFRVLLAGAIQENSLEALGKGITPKLGALQLHNSTVYRWNRPCYGISPNGQPHLRIENRILPAGPTVVDEYANAAFWLGLMVGMEEEVADITKHISWEDVRDNFGKAARFGIDSKFTWFKDQKITACDLVLKHLLPIARKGLLKQKIAKKDINKYLSIIEARATKHMNGARWALRSFTKLKKETNKDEALSVLTACMLKNQHKGKPVHTWDLPKLSDLKDYQPAHLKVEEIMETDLFTVRQEDIIEFVAEMMDWKSIRYVPVEDTKGNLIGLVTSRILLKQFTKRQRLKEQKVITVQEVMKKNPITISPETSVLEAIKIMKNKKIGCLLVVNGKELSGVVTESNFLSLAGRLIERGGEE